MNVVIQHMQQGSGGDVVFMDCLMKVPVAGDAGLEQTNVVGYFRDILLDFPSKPARLLGRGAVIQKKGSLLLTVLHSRTDVKKG
jgi:hypothetical protein